MEIVEGSDPLSLYTCTIMYIHVATYLLGDPRGVLKGLQRHKKLFVEGDIGVCGIAVLSHFLMVLRYFRFKNCGIAVSLKL